MSQLLRFGIILALICFTATFVLAITYEVTKPKIDEQLKAEEQAGLKAIMPEADSFQQKTIDGITYFDAYKDDRLVGYCIKVTGTGYSGYIRMLVGVDTDGIITGIRVLEQYETPGLGARIVEIKHEETEPWFLRQVVGKSAGTVEVNKDIDAISGATISSRGVTEAVNKTVNEFFAAIKRRKE